MDHFRGTLFSPFAPERSKPGNVDGASRQGLPTAGSALGRQQNIDPPSTKRPNNDNARGLIGQKRKVCTITKYVCIYDPGNKNFSPKIDISGMWYKIRKSSI